MAIRSILTIPSADPEAVERARATEVGAVMLDLRAGGAHADVARLLRGRSRPGAAVWARLGAVDRPETGAELSALLQTEPDALMLSCAESVADIEHLGALLAVAEAERGLADGTVRIVAMIETAGALFELHRLARASSRLIGVAWDGEALARDLGSEVDRDPDGRWIDPLQTARTLTLAAAADAGLPVFDSPFVGAGSEAFRKEAECAARDGFSGKLAVDARQAAIVESAFAGKG